MHGVTDMGSGPWGRKDWHIYGLYIRAFMVHTLPTFIERTCEVARGMNSSSMEGVYQACFETITMLCGYCSSTQKD